ncbi:MAG: tyrosine-type recombinase/integrase [Gammaproteobacteria bacterium]
MTNDLIKYSADTVLPNEENNPIKSWINNLYINVATSDNTRMAYQSDIRHFERWGGILPTSPEVLIQYLQTFATKLNSRTIARRLIAIRHWHKSQSFPDPTIHPAIQKTMVGITRLHGKPKDKARPLSLEDLLTIVRYLENENSFASFRDNALLQIGYFGALRRSELVAIECEHIQWKKEGIDILIPQSKTDQENDGQYCGIPFGKKPLCPVNALRIWLEIANIKQGAIFREIKRGEKLKETCLSPLSVNFILKKRANECGLAYADQFSGHSLRRGLATTASSAGANMAAIMRQGRWKQINTIMEYVDATNRFSDNVITKILQTTELEDECK